MVTRDYRQHAKSTAVTLAYTIASICFRESSFILVVSDTETQASGFVDSIKRQFTLNDDLKAMFGVKQLIKDSVNDIIIEFDDGHQERVLAKGSGQSLRGALWNDKRPDLVIGDDLENDEIVMNKERRQKFRRWFNGTLIPVLSKKGKLRLVGTILHADSLLERFMPKKGQDGVTESKSKLALYSDPRKVWLSAKYKAHDPMFTIALWPENKGVEWLRKERETFKEQGELDLWAQEMLNVPLDESSAPFQRRDFIPMADEDFNRNFNYYIGTDFAFKEDQKADFTAFVVAAVDEGGHLFIVNVVKERMDVNESQDVLFELILKYDPQYVFFEKGQMWNALEVTIKERMLRTGVFFLYEAFASTVDKRVRASPIISRMRAGAVRFNKNGAWYEDFEDECVAFPRIEHDDQVDALALIGRGLLKFREAPSPDELRDEAYEEDKQSTGYYDEGREEITGY